MSLRWSPLLTLLLSLPGTALARDLPDGSAAPEPRAAQTSPALPGEGDAPFPEGLDARSGEPAERPTLADTQDPEQPVESDAGGFSDEARNAEAQAPVPMNPAPQGGAAEEGAPPQLHRVELIDGQSLVGILRSRDAHGVMLEIGEGPRIYLSRSTIAQVSAEAPEPPASERPLRPQAYFLAPSAMLLKEGQGSFAQLELLLSEFSYGITDNLNFSIGSILPFWFANAGQGFNMLAAVKAGGSVNEVLHLAAGAYGVFVPAALNSGVAALGVGFGSLTVGTPDRNATISIGIPVAAAGPVEGVLVNISGMLRVSRIVSLTSELWSFSSEEPLNTWAWGGGTRLDLRPFSVDVGIFLLGQGGNIVPVPLPWLSAAYNFG